MTEPRIRLITRGDDSGSNHTANVAILDAFRQGILRNTSVMIPAPAVEDAAKLLAGERGLCCGLHATLNAEWDAVRWGPVLPAARVPSLVDEQGHFFQTTRALHDNDPRLEEVMAELEAQLALARQLGFDMRYADMHMGFGWVVPGLPEAFAEWGEREGLVLSRSFQGLPRVDVEGDPVERLIAALEAAAPGQYLIVGHPGYDNEEMRLLGHAGYPGDVVAAGRVWERRLFMDPRIVAYCRERGVLPVRFDEA